MHCIALRCCCVALTYVSLASQPCLSPSPSPSPPPVSPLLLPYLPPWSLKTKGNSVDVELQTGCHGDCQRLFVSPACVRVPCVCACVFLCACVACSKGSGIGGTAALHVVPVPRKPLQVNGAAPLFAASPRSFQRPSHEVIQRCFCCGRRRGRRPGRRLFFFRCVT